MNDSILDNSEVVEEINALLLGAIRLYSDVSPDERWEIMKEQVTLYCKDKSIRNAHEDKVYKFNLYKLLSRMQNRYIKGDVTNEFNENVDRVRREIASFEESEAKKAAFRCKCRWESSGELPSKYFFHLEKRNFVSKTMYMVRRPDGTITKDYAEILNLQFDFYNKLYSRDDTVRFNLTNNSGVLIGSDQKQMCESEITVDELFDAMMTLKANVTPGCDGLSIKFYRIFWKTIAPTLTELYHFNITQKRLHRSARKAIVNLIPKKDKDDLLLKSWRGISLLNNDYKIFAKLIANRLQIVAPNLIGNQQNGFVPGRTLASNIMRTTEVVAHMNRVNKPGIVVMIDFEKCFDRIEHNSIEGVFRYFGFGQYMIGLIMMLFKDIQVCTLNNGYTSDFFVKGRGINQGCNASPLIYTYCGEILNHVVNHNSQGIKGIEMNLLKNILSQFADDTAAFLQYNQESLDAFIESLSCVETNMGLKVSYEKTTLYRIGSLQNSNAELYTKKNFAWSNDAIDTLGVTLKCDGTKDESNFQSILTKLNTVCETWFNRKLSLFGKILIINTLMGSLFVYKMMVLTNFTSEQLKTVNAMISKFLWSNRKPKISFETLCKKKEQGGLKLVNLDAKQKALKITWIFKIDSDEFLANQCYEALNPVLGPTIWLCNLSKKDSKLIFGDGSIWHQIMEAWSEINHYPPTSYGEVRSQIIWLNSFIRVKR